MQQRLTISLILIAILLGCVESRAQQPGHVAPTDALSPSEQQKKFLLPEGFEIQLVASDPEIGQPMNLAFDARGRLWLTHSVEYPYPAQSDGVEPRGRLAGTGGHPPRDRLTIVESIGPAGRATNLRHFAEGLNIPIGQTPLGDGSEALVYSIPAIFHCKDTDGDGQSDQRKVLYGRFGNIDTHGMSNSYTPWIDGWIYGCHGFSNHSIVRDGSGNETEMRSGNTYRFRPDGSRFEQFTYGQVNPFGMAFDALGNLYNADCHSMPVTMLLRGANYPHFGNKAGPLGFGPTMIDHNHGSTGICGVAYYAADHFPSDFRHNLYICNPVTGRVHRDKLKQTGSTYQIDTQPDFVRCDDPWFRPVDVQLGPDGALYIADFYNAVIGHYEVPLEHPKRDRNHGRVWRVVYRGPAGQVAPRPIVDLAKLDVEQLVAQLASVNLLLRTQATNLLVELHADQAAAAVRKSLDDSPSPEMRTHGLWVIERLGENGAGGLSDLELAALAADSNSLVRVHLLKALAERPQWQHAHYDLARAALADDDAFVRRAAADALGRHLAAKNLVPLLAVWNEAAPGDTHLVHVVKMALRSHFDDPRVGSELLAIKFSQQQTKRLLEIATASEGSSAAAFLLSHSASGDSMSKTLQRAIPTIARHGTPEQVLQVIGLARTSFPLDFKQQFTLFRLVEQGLAQRGERAEQNTAMRDWFTLLASPLLNKLDEACDDWAYEPLSGEPSSADSNSPSPWGVRQRSCSDGETISVLDSIVHGEQRTGVARSRQFELPTKLSFWMCGHNGAPGTDPPPVNHVRLRLVEGGEVIARQTAPRNDTAQKYTWALGEQAGQQAVFEIVDADTRPAYAWIAVGRFEPALLCVPEGESDTSFGEALALIGRFQLRPLLPDLLRLAADEAQSAPRRIESATAALRLGGRETAMPILAQLLRNARTAASARLQAAEVLGTIDSDEARRVLVETLPQASAPLQRAIALSLGSSPQGAAMLLAAIAEGKASAQLLQDAEVANRLRRDADDTMQQRIMKLTEGLPSIEARIVELIAQRRAGYQASQALAVRGQAVFKKHCAVCHKVGSEGQTVGPQLDGIGLRGIDRLLEDVLNPNRNVDAAFRSVTIATVDGKVLTGLRRREEGQVLIIADQQGKEIGIATGDIDQIKPTNLSLMPANLVETLQPAEFNDLLAYLLALQTPHDVGQ